MRKTWFSGDPLENLVDEAKMYDGFIRALDAELKQHPKSVLNQDSKTKSVGSPSTIPSGSVVFLVHGHDELNLLRLKEVLATRWKLEPVILSSEAGKGRTIIEKFEGEAARATFAFVLMSPDDQISAPQGGYAQSRPNVIFELGWFYGRLGRDRVCILFKKGTHIHSDLDGVSRIEFVASVNEKIEEIERELTTAKVLGKRSRSAGV
jgi:predicted nucleotide-binding protein